jgi:hypothetical protein
VYLKNLVKKLFPLLILLALSLEANTMFLLTKINKAYLVVENYSSKLSKDVKFDVLEELQNAADELNIDTSGYSYRTLAFIVFDSYLDDNLVVNVELVLGEEIKRLDDKEEVYALTYRKSKQFITNGKDVDEIEEEFFDSVDTLLSDFKDQYIEDNE